MAEPYQDVHGRRAVGVGGNKDIPLVRALDGHLATLQGVQREVGNSAKDLKIVHERTVRMQGTLANIEHQSANLVSAISESISAAATAVIDRVKPALDAAVQTAENAAVEATRRLDATNRPPGWTPPSSAAVGRQGAPLGTAANPIVVTPVSDPASHTPTTRHLDPRATGTWHPGNPAGPEGAPGTANADAWGQGRQFGVGALRQSLGRAIGQGLQEVGRPPAELVQNNRGEWQRRGPHGHFAGPATEDEIADFHRARRTRAIMANYGGSIVESGGLGRGVMNALPGVIGKGLGVAGAAVTIGQQVAGFEQSQRRANNEFLAVNGGGQAAAFRERGAGEAFQRGQQLRTLFGGGGLNGEEADQLFMGTTRLGLHGNERQAALNFGTENFRKFGMEISESLEMITTAAETGQQNLNTLASALDTVSEAAVRGGVNAQQARKNFSAAYTASAGNFTGQGTAATASGALASAFAGMGKEFQNIDYSGAFDQQRMRMIAAQTGQTFNQVVESQGQQGGVGYARNYQALVTNLAGQQVGSAGISAIQRLAQEARNKGETEPDGSLSNETIKRITAEAEKATGTPMDRGALAQVLGGVAGLQGVDPNNSLEVLTQFLSMNANPEAEATKIAGQSKTFSTRGDEGRKTLASSLGMSEGDIKGLSGHGGFGGSTAGGSAGSRFAQIKGRFGESMSQLRHPLDTIKHPNSDRTGTEARMRYAQQAAKSGHASPIIAALLKDYDPERRIKVRGLGKDGKGQDRVMTVEEALKFHSDQLERGTAEIVQGRGAGETVADATGLQGDMSVGLKSDKDTKGRKTGHEFSEWDKRWGSGKDGGNVKGKITVEPTRELARLLRFPPSVNLGATTPPDPHSRAPLPSGNPGVGG